MFTGHHCDFWHRLGAALPHVSATSKLEPEPACGAAGCLSWPGVQGSRYVSLSTGHRSLGPPGLAQLGQRELPWPCVALPGPTACLAVPPSRDAVAGGL